MTTTEEMKAAATEAARWWWLWLVAGILWILVSLIILQFDSSSVRSVRPSPRAVPMIDSAFARSTGCSSSDGSVGVS